MNPTYQRLQAGFGEWLRILNFEKDSQKAMPRLLHCFLLYLEKQGCYQIRELQETILKNYLEKLQDDGLSLNYIRKHMQVIKKFSRYLAESGQESFEVNIKLKGKSSNIKNILTTLEITRLYDLLKDDVLGLRDRAMLSLYYGCGLRKNEGISLNTSDIQLEKELVYVRKGKGYKARYVPLSGQNKQDIEAYLHYSRPYLQSGSQQNEALLLNIKGKRLSGVTAFERLQKLKAQAGISKTIGLHTLRHSIATHLLWSGMKLEQIQRFLGHNSMESTQLYTHIIHETAV